MRQEIGHESERREKNERVELAGRIKATSCEKEPDAIRSSGLPIFLLDHVRSWRIAERLADVVYRGAAAPSNSELRVAARVSAVDSVEGAELPVGGFNANSLLDEGRTAARLDVRCCVDVFDHHDEAVLVCDVRDEAVEEVHVEVLEVVLSLELG